MSTEDDVDLAALADGTLSGPTWDAWLAAHPEAAAEVALARRVRALLVDLHARAIPVPADFQARLLQRVHADTTLLDLLDLGLAGLGHAAFELLLLLLDLLSPAPPHPAR